jgi:hypothetical protein
MDLLPVKNTKEAYDKVFLFGQKTNCSAIAWNYYDSTTPATTPCVPIGDPRCFMRNKVQQFFQSCPNLFSTLLRFTGIGIGMGGGPQTLV